MYRFVLLLGLLLGGCQSHNPYQADSLPLPNAPALNPNFLDLSAYPAASRDLSQYRSWRWQTLPTAENWATSEELAQVFANELEQQGLRPATNADADLLVRANTGMQQRAYQQYPDAGFYYGQGHLSQRRYGHHGLYGQVPLGSTVYEQNLIVAQLELIDARNGEVVWRGAAAQPAGSSTSQNLQALREAVQQALRNLSGR